MPQQTDEGNYFFFQLKNSEITRENLQEVLGIMKPFKLNVVLWMGCSFFVILKNH